MGRIARAYKYLFQDIADPRVYDWPFMSDPLEICIILVIYLCCIKVVLPLYMTNRAPYNLKRIIVAFDIFQILACSMMVYGSVTSGWISDYTLGCQPADYSGNKMAMRMASYMWWMLVIKIIDLFETFIYVLRKKRDQVTTLHVYHHISTALIAWFLVKYFGGGMGSFPLTINNAVHVLMYTYYLLASIGPQIQKKLEIVKPKMTLTQMVQLVVIQIHVAQTLLPSCQVSAMLGAGVILHASSNLAFFVAFYRNRYIKRKVD